MMFIFHHNDIGLAIISNEMACLRTAGGIHSCSQTTRKKEVYIVTQDETNQQLSPVESSFFLNMAEDASTSKQLYSSL